MTKLVKCDYCGKIHDTHPTSNFVTVTVDNVFATTIAPRAQIFHYCLDCYGYYVIGVNLGQKEMEKVKEAKK